MSTTLDPLDVARLHDLIDAVFFSTDGKLYKQIAARMAIEEHYTKHDAALRARIDELETQLFIEKAEPALSLFN